MLLQQVMQSEHGQLLSEIQIDVVVSNNDGMGMSMFNAWSKDNKVPTFGYDANSDAVAAIAEGYGGTISQHADVQAYLTLEYYVMHLMV